MTAVWTHVDNNTWNYSLFRSNFAVLSSFKSHLICIQHLQSLNEFQHSLLVNWKILIIHNNSEHTLPHSQNTLCRHDNETERWEESLRYISIAVIRTLVLCLEMMLKSVYFRDEMPLWHNFIFECVWDCSVGPATIWIPLNFTTNWTHSHVGNVYRTNYEISFHCAQFHGTAKYISAMALYTMMILTVDWCQRIDNDNQFN